MVEEDQARLQKLFKSQEQRRRQLQGVSASEADPPGALRQVGLLILLGLGFRGCLGCRVRV